MRVVVYSGSFDPIHQGHLALTRYVATEVKGVDAVWLLVTPRNPLKPGATHASFSQRMEMTELALRGIPNAMPSAFENSLPAPHYTITTLLALRQQYPLHTFSLLIGSDNWEIFHSWHRSGEILKEFEILIYPRPGFPVDTSHLPDSVRFLADAPLCDISSTVVRNEIAEGRSAAKLLPSDVSSYITHNKLYGQPFDRS